MTTQNKGVEYRLDSYTIQKPRRGVIYARYSSGGNQTDQSIEGQLRECHSYATQHNIQIVGEYIDRHISGKDVENRISFQRMIADSDKHLFDVVIVWKTDRFARNRYDSARYKERLKRNGVAIRYAAENIPEGSEGIILESILEGMAEYYSEDLKQKVLRGMKESAYKCKVLTCPPIGYFRGKNGEYVIDEATAPYVRQIFEMYANGDKMRVIAETMNRLGLRTVRKNPLNANSIAKMIQNEHYIGVYEYKNGGIRKEDAIPAIVSKELFYRAQERRKKQQAGAYSKRNYGGAAKHDYLLSGIVFCGQCGSPMFGETTVKYGDTGQTCEYQYYSCQGHRRGRRYCGCDVKGIPAWTLESAVQNCVKRLFENEAFLERLCDVLAKVEMEQNGKERLQALKAQRRKKKVAIQNIMNAFDEGVYTASMVEHLKELETEVHYIERDIEPCKNSATECKEKVRWLLTVYRSNQPDNEFWKKLIHYFVKSVTCFSNQTVVIRLNLFHQAPPDGPVIGIELQESIERYFNDNASNKSRVKNCSLHQSEYLFGNGFHQNDFRTNSFFADYQLYYHEHSLIVRTIIP